MNSATDRPSGPGHRRPASLGVRLGLVLLGGWLTPAPAIAAGRPAEQWLPAETLAYVTLPSASGVRQETQRQVPFGAWSDPALAPFRAHFEKHVDARFLGPLAQVTGFPLERLRDLAEGQVTLALLPPPPATPPTEPLVQLLLLDAGSQAPELARLLAGARSNAVPAGTAPPKPGATTWTESRWRDLPVVTFSFPGDRLDAVFDNAFPAPDGAGSPTPTTPPLPLRVHTILAGTVLVACTESNRFLEVLEHLAAPTPSAPPAAAPPFAADASRFTNTLVHGWLNGPATLRHLTNNPPPILAGLARGDIGLPRVINALGFNQLRSASFAVRAGPDGWSNDLHLAVPAAGRKGLFSLLQVLPADASPPPWLGSDVVSFRRVRLPGTAAWDTLERILRDLDPAFLGVLQLFTGYAGKTEDADFDFRKGLIDRLGNDWMMLSVRLTTNTAPGELLLHGSTNAPLLHGALRLIASPVFLSTFLPPDAPGPVRRELDLPGGRLVSLVLSNTPWSDNGTGTEELHFGARSDTVVLSHGVALPTAFLSLTNLGPARRPLASSPALVDALPRVGGAGGGWLDYTSEREVIEDTLQGLSRNEAPLEKALRWAAVSETATRVVAGIGSWLDLDLLPAPGLVARHFHIRVQGGHAGPDGLHLTTFRPRVPGPVTPPPLPGDPAAVTHPAAGRSSAPAPPKP